MKEEGTKTPTEWEGVRGKEGEGPAIEGPTGQKKHRAVYNTVHCCSAPLSGIEGRVRTIGFCPRGEGQQLQRSPPFQPIWLWLPLLTAAACSASGHMRSTVAPEWPPRSCGGAAGSPRQQGNDTQRFRAALKRLSKGSNSRWSELPIMLDLESQKSHSKWPNRIGKLGAGHTEVELVPCG